MKTQYAICLFLAYGILLNSCSIDGIKASNNIITEERTLANFDEVDVSDDMEVIIKQGELQSVKVTTSDNIIYNVTTRVDSGKLVARLKGNIRRLNVMRLEITMPTINRLSLSADSFGRLSGFENLDTFRVRVSSDAFISLSGSALSMDIDASSDAKIEGFDFQTKTCNVDCSSDASISITCADALTGSVSSDGVLFYRGNPTVNVSTSSDGAVINSN
ncbi:GIN domain-containing protein [Hyunsoonleella rubra]|uniref:GIN domain-containing protein n=1 Tax=Hyunsoonleella rubra TaxID=1737062 RepID=A0ABW5T9U5_9FLAO